MIELKGNYLLKLDFGSTDANINFGNIKEFTIIQELDKFLPSFRIKLIDSEGLATHINPFDKGMSRVSVQFGSSSAGGEYNGMDFLVYRRHPAAYFTTSVEFDMVGLLEAEGLLAPNYSRSFGSIADAISQVAEDMKIDTVESTAGGTTTEAAILQPNWTNAQLINWLKQNLGDEDNTAFKCFVKVVDGKKVLVFKSIQDLVGGGVRYNFIVNDSAVQDYFPVFDYQVIDNYKIYGTFGGRVKPYQYYDYTAGEFITSEVGLDNFNSLSDYFAIDSNDSEESESPFFGRNNDFTEEFVGRAQSGYHSRIAGLVKMWILTWGLPNVAPGDVIRLLFGQGVATGQLFSYQYSGYWLVERVVHIFGETHRTRLLLTRNGLDTDKGTTLVPASRRKR